MKPSTFAAERATSSTRDTPARVKLAFGRARALVSHHGQFRHSSQRYGSRFRLARAKHDMSPVTITRSDEQLQCRNEVKPLRLSNSAHIAAAWDHERSSYIGDGGFALCDPSCSVKLYPVSIRRRLTRSIWRAAQPNVISATVAIVHDTGRLMCHSGSYVPVALHVNCSSQQLQCCQ